MIDEQNPGGSGTDPTVDAHGASEGCSGMPPSGAPGSARRQSPDPLGRRALFWHPTDPPRSPRQSSSSTGVRRRADGKRALFSASPGDPTADVDGDGWSSPAIAYGVEHASDRGPVDDRGRFVVSCASCGGEARIGLLDLLIFQFPLGFWLPRGRYDHRMTCPLCRRRVWAGITVRRSR